MKVFIPQILIDRIEEESLRSFMAINPFDYPNKIILFSKNTLKNYVFKNPIQCQYRFGWIAEIKSVPSYFKDCILQIED